MESSNVQAFWCYGIVLLATFRTWVLGRGTRESVLIKFGDYSWIIPLCTCREN